MSSNDSITWGFRINLLWSVFGFIFIAAAAATAHHQLQLELRGGATLRKKASVRPKSGAYSDLDDVEDGGDGAADGGAAGAASEGRRAEPAAPNGVRRPSPLGMPEDDVDYDEDGLVRLHTPASSEAIRYEIGRRMSVAGRLL